MTRWIDASQVSKLLKPGQTVFIAGATAEPREILEALAHDSESCAGVRFVSVSVPGLNTVDFSKFNVKTKSTAFFATPQNKANIAAGKVDFIPMQYRAIYDYLENEIDIDIAIVQLPPAGADGLISQGITADFLPAVLSKAKVLIGEINDAQPAPANSLKLSQDQLDYAVKCSCPVPTFPETKIDETAKKIGLAVADLINDGDCIQIGIGAIPDATLNALSQKNDLGFHSGMIAGGVKSLVESGAMTGAAKRIDTGLAVIGATLGSIDLINWVGSSQAMAFRPVNYTHDPATIRQIDNFVSINSALEIDLFGQVNADMLKGHQVSGTGGSVDMIRGAALSKNGRSIIALNATASKGKLSRIVPAMSPVNATTALRSDIDYVVTEFGARRIKHLPVQARAQALIELAAPEFRDHLREQWQILSSV